MPKYAALIYRVEAEWPEQGSPASRQLYQAWGAFNQVCSTGETERPFRTKPNADFRGSRTPFSADAEQGFRLMPNTPGS